MLLWFYYGIDSWFERMGLLVREEERREIEKEREERERVEKEGGGEMRDLIVFEVLVELFFFFLR